VPQLQDLGSTHAATRVAGRTRLSALRHTPDGPRLPPPVQNMSSCAATRALNIEIAARALDTHEYESRMAAQHESTRTYTVAVVFFDHGFPRPSQRKALPSITASPVVNQLPEPARATSGPCRTRRRCRAANVDQPRPHSTRRVRMGVSATRSLVAAHVGALGGGPLRAAVAVAAAALVAGRAAVAVPAAPAPAAAATAPATPAAAAPAPAPAPAAPPARVALRHLGELRLPHLLPVPLLLLAAAGGGSKTRGGCGGVRRQE